MAIYAHVPWKSGDLSSGYSFTKGRRYVYLHQMSLNIKYIVIKKIIKYAYLFNFKLKF